jgi:hypothetical protein
MTMPEGISEKGITRRTDILNAMERMEGESITQKALAEHLGIPAQNLHYHLKRMEKEGLIQMKIPPAGSLESTLITWPEKGKVEHPTPSQDTPAHDTPSHDTPLPDKAVEVHQKEEKAGIVQPPEIKPIYVAGIRLTEEEAAPVRKLMLERKPASPEAPGKEIMTAPIDSPAPEPEAPLAAGTIGKVPEMALPPICKNHPDRPAVINPQGHSVKYCEECFAVWGRQGKEKQMKKKLSGDSVKQEPKIFPEPDLSLLGFTQTKDSLHYAEERLFFWTIDRLPPFDASWTEEVWERWIKLWGYLWDIARDLDGTEREGPVTAIVEDIRGMIEKLIPRQPPEGG